MIWTLPFHKELLDVAGFLDLHLYLKHYNFSSIREIGKQYGIPESTLWKRRDMLGEGIPLVGSGSKTALTP